MRSPNPVALSAALEAATGVALVVVPAVVVRLLLGNELSGAGFALARLCGVALVSMSIACWPGGGATRPARALFVYNACTALYLGYLRFSGPAAAPLLLPAAAAHVVFAFLLACPRRT